MAANASGQAGGGGQAVQGSDDVARIQAMLKEAGVTDYDPRVVNQLLDIAYTTTAKLLTDARAVSQHCNKMTIDETDAQIAVEFGGYLKDYRADRETTLEIAKEKNAQPLPPIRHNFGLKLPNDRFCLLQPNVEWRGQTQPLTAPPVQRSRGMEPTAGMLRPDHAQNLLKRKIEDDFDS